MLETTKINKAMYLCGDTKHVVDFELWFVDLFSDIYHV